MAGGSSDSYSRPDVGQSFQLGPGVRVMTCIVPQMEITRPKAKFIPTMITFYKNSSLLMVLRNARIYDKNYVVTCHSRKFVI